LAHLLRVLSSYDLRKIEIGSGQNPQPGCAHVEVTSNFPDVDIVCDVSSERLPIADGVSDEVLANHVIEHIPWRNLTFVVSEWNRILRPGGRVVLRTPNLKKICEQYLKGEISPEWPADMDALIDTFGSFGPSQWALVKLFSGQDYPSNFHFNCLDFNSCKSLFEKNGFVDCKEIDIEPKFSPFELQFQARKES